MQAFLAPKISLQDVDDLPEDIRELDELFRCPICYTYMQNVVAFSRCQHHFCSVCINRALVFKDECPSCRSKYDDGNTLKPNKYLDTIIKQYTKASIKIASVLNNSKTNSNQAASSHEIKQIRNLTPDSKQFQRPIPIETLNNKIEINKTPIKSSKKRRRKEVISLVSDDDRGSPSNNKENIKSSQNTQSNNESQSLLQISPQNSNSQDAKVLDFQQSQDLRSPENTPEKASPALLEKSQESALITESPELLDKSQIPKSQQQERPSSALITESPELLDKSQIPKSQQQETPSQKSERSESSESSEKLDSQDDFQQTQVSENIITCPNCSLSVNKKRFEEHKEICIAQDESRERLRKKAKPSSETRKKLPKLTYNLLSEKKIKQLLREHNLPTKGDKTTLAKRHREFTIRYNAECDSSNPRPIEEIVKEMLLEEEKLTTPATHNIKSANSDFKNLIEDVKRRKRKKT